MNVLDMAGLLAHSFGRWKGVDGGEVAEVVDEANFRYLRLCFDEDVLIGALTIGPVAHIGTIRGMIQTRTRLGAWKDRLLEKPHLISEAYVATLTANGERGRT
jgi:NAD(P)H-nitrite reductase large subunit